MPTNINELKGNEFVLRVRLLDIFNGSFTDKDGKMVEYGYILVRLGDRTFKFKIKNKLEKDISPALGQDVDLVIAFLPDFKTMLPVCSLLDVQFTGNLL